MVVVTRFLLGSHRLAQRLHDMGLTPIAQIIKLISRILFAVEIDFRAQIGHNLQLPHPAGVVIGRGSVLGDNVQLGANVVLGGNLGKSRDDATYPRIGSNVRVGPGAAILGPVVICDGVIIGANSVVTRDITSSGVYAGSPVAHVRDLTDQERSRFGEPSQ